MKRAKTDNELRSALVNAGKLGKIHNQEDQLGINRDSLDNRKQYRAMLESLCDECGINLQADIAPGYKTNQGYGLL